MHQQLQGAVDNLSYLAANNGFRFSTTEMKAVHFCDVAG